MIEFLIQHQFWAAVVIYWIFSAAVSAMPEATNASPGYLWLYRFVHTIAGNLTTAFGSRIPGLKIPVLLLVAPLVLSTAACAAHYKIHPGALNATDSAAYDTLLIAETTIDQARLDYQNQLLPARAKDALNTLIQAYTVARESWLVYRGALANNVPPDLYIQQLAKNLSDLTTAIRALRESAASASPIGRSHQSKDVKQ
jgi:hypothetical protein